jgi:CBS domain-containing protein
MAGGTVGGLLTRADLLRTMASEGPDVYIAGAMNRDFVRLDPNLDLDQAVPLLARGGNCALVMERDELIGLLTNENLSEFLVIRQIGQKRE